MTDQATTDGEGSSVGMSGYAASFFRRQRYQVECSSANLIKSGADPEMVRICLSHFNDLAEEAAAHIEALAPRGEGTEAVAWRYEHRDGGWAYTDSPHAAMSSRGEPLYAHPSGAAVGALREALENLVAVVKYNRAVWGLSERECNATLSEALAALSSAQDGGSSSPKSEDTQPGADGAVLVPLDEISALCTSFNDQIHDADDTLGKINQLAYTGIAALRPALARPGK